VHLAQQQGAVSPAAAAAVDINAPLQSPLTCPGVVPASNHPLPSSVAPFLLLLAAVLTLSTPASPAAGPHYLQDNEWQQTVHSLQDSQAQQESLQAEHIEPIRLPSVTGPCNAECSLMQTTA